VARPGQRAEGSAGLSQGPTPASANAAVPTLRRCSRPAFFSAFPFTAAGGDSSSRIQSPPLRARESATNPRAHRWHSVSLLVSTAGKLQPVVPAPPLLWTVFMVIACRRLCGRSVRAIPCRGSAEIPRELARGRDERISIKLPTSAPRYSEGSVQYNLSRPGLPERKLSAEVHVAGMSPEFRSTCGRCRMFHCNALVLLSRGR